VVARENLLPAKERAQPAMLKNLAERARLQRASRKECRRNEKLREASYIAKLNTIFELYSLILLAR